MTITIFSFVAGILVIVIGIVLGITLQTLYNEVKKKRAKQTPA